MALRRRRVSDRLERPGADRLCFAFCLDEGDVAKLETPAEGGCSSLADEDRTCLCSLFQTCGRVHGVARYERLVRRWVARRDDLARVDAEPDFEPATEDRVVPDAVSELQRCRAGPGRIIVVGGRQTEHGHDRIADELLE